MLNESSKAFARKSAVFVSLFCLCLAFMGCATKKQSTRQLYDEAYRLYSKKSYYWAKPKFEEIIQKDPLNKYAVKSELHLAEIYFEEENFDDSLLHYEEYLRLNPRADEYEYVKYRIGMSHFGLMSTYDRDQTETALALKSFRSYFDTYPDGKYVADVRSKTDAAIALLLKSEYSVGKFYFKSKKYEAAVNRCDNILRKFKKGEFIEDTYLILAKSLDKLSKEVRLKEVYEEYVKRFPSGRLTDELSELLKDRS